LQHSARQAERGKRATQQIEQRFEIAVFASGCRVPHQQQALAQAVATGTSRGRVRLRPRQRSALAFILFDHGQEAFEPLQLQAPWCYFK